MGISKFNGRDKGGDGSEFSPVKKGVDCPVCNDQGQIQDVSKSPGEQMSPCPRCAPVREEITQGEYLVGHFGGPGNESIGMLKFKKETAKLLDDLGGRMAECMQEGGNDGAGRCYAIAMSKYEEACMWAVKGLTKPPLGE